MSVQAVAHLSWRGGKDPESMVLVSTPCEEGANGTAI